MGEAKEIEILAVKIMYANNYVIYTASIFEGKLLQGWKFNKEYFN